jgi:hypothetical protein
MGHDDFRSSPPRLTVLGPGGPSGIPHPGCGDQAWPALPFGTGQMSRECYLFFIRLNG